MKKIVYWLFMLPLFALLNGCDDTDTIIFDDELPQFEIKANAILLEVIMPKGSAADDEYYIVGDFNGGAEAAVVIWNGNWRKLPEVNPSGESICYLPLLKMEKHWQTASTSYRPRKVKNVR